MFIAITMM